MSETAELSQALDAVIAETSFSGVVRIDIGGAAVIERAAGFADRGHGVEMTVNSRIGVASGAKSFTALTVMALVERGVLALDTRARELLGDTLPSIDATVTVEHLLAHRSGIGDYLDESEIDDITTYVMPIPVHLMADPESYVPALDGHPQVFPPGERFAYNNAGFVVLALLAERAARMPYHDLVDELVIAPAGLTHTAFLRSDELPGDAAIGYLAADGLRTNLLHLPVRGVGDGGIVTTAADVHQLWTALDAGRIVSAETVVTMTRPHSDDTGSSAGHRYGLGFWLPATDGTVEMEGYDAGASFRSTHRAADGLTVAVLSNWTDGAWPVVRRLEALLGL
jgi:CubicO group peptidase (beta-lactamase class C family)